MNEIKLKEHATDDKIILCPTCNIKLVLQLYVCKRLMEDAKTKRIAHKLNVSIDGEPNGVQAHNSIK